MKIFKKLDDELHFWAGLLIMLFFFVIFANSIQQWLAAVLSFVVSCAAGLAKEFYDKYIKKTKFDWRDVKWTALGAFVFTVIFIVADILYYYSKP